MEGTRTTPLGDSVAARELDTRIGELRSEDPSLSYATASARAAAQNPDLAAALLNESGSAAPPAPAKPFDFGSVGDVQNHHWHPTDPRTREEITAVTWIVAGEDTTHYRRALADVQRMQIEANVRGKNFSVEAFTRELAARVVLEWEGMVWNGKVLAHSADNVRMVLTERRFLFDDFREFLASRDRRLGKL